MELSDASMVNALAGLVQERLGRGDRVTFTIVSESMQPWLSIGSRVLVQPATAGALRIGDVVMAPTSDGRWNIHRIIHRYQRDGRQFVVTKGDASTRADATRAASEIAGLVTEVAPPKDLDGRWFSLLSPPMRRIATAAAILSRAEAALARVPLGVVQRSVSAVARRLQRLLRNIAWFFYQLNGYQH